MTALHLRFRHLDAEVLTATAALLEARTSEQHPGQALAEYQRWADTASGAYDLPRVTVLAGPTAGSPGYTPGTLRLPRPGIVALLTGYRRHMQHHGVTQAGATPDDDAYAWALSLYHTVRPRQLARLAAADKIPHLTLADFSAVETARHLGIPVAGTPADTHGQGTADRHLPIDDGMRRAIFAALRDRYGADLSRDDRLDRLSLAVGRQLTSMRDLTRGEGSRILDFLGSDPAADQAARDLLRSARAFIRQAATEHRITVADRDRYLAILADAQNQTAGRSTADLRDAIRNAAIRLYLTDQICEGGRDDFLAATGLHPYTP